MAFAIGTRNKALYVTIPEKKVIADRLYFSHETKWTLEILEFPQKSLRHSFCLISTYWDHNKNAELEKSFSTSRPTSFVFLLFSALFQKRWASLNLVKLLVKHPVMLPNKKDLKFVGCNSSRQACSLKACQNKLSNALSIRGTYHHELIHHSISGMRNVLY